LHTEFLKAPLTGIKTAKIILKGKVSHTVLTECSFIPRHQSWTYR